MSSRRLLRTQNVNVPTELGSTNGNVRRRRRVLVAITYGFSVRYLLSTGVLDRLAVEVDPVVALGWDDADLVGELTGRGISSVRLPDAVLGPELRRLRRQVDLIHQRRLSSPSTRIERRQREALVHSRSARVIGAARRTRDAVVVRGSGSARRLETAEANAVVSDSNRADFEQLLSRIEPDLVVSITPYHEQDTSLLNAAAAFGVPSLTSVISFDNPTTRRRFPTVSDPILVWNHHNRSELIRSYPSLQPSRVRTIGAPQFDLHRRPDLLLDESTWRAQLSLPPDRPVILYGGGPAYLVPDEPRLVRLIDSMIDAGNIHGDPVLLVRRHPAEAPGPWRELAGDLRHGVVADPWAPGSDPSRGWPSDDDIRIQMSTLAHSTVHVNVCSSMTLDGAMFDRPQIGPTFVPGLDRRTARRVRDLYVREHWWPITASGGLVTVDSPAELERALNEALAHPGAGREGRRRMIMDLLGVDDGGAGERLVHEVVAAAQAASVDPSAFSGGPR